MRSGRNNPPLESLNEGDIIRTEDGFTFICVPDAASASQKALTDGDIWIDDEGELDGDYCVIDQAEAALLVSPECMEVFRFILRRSQEQAEYLNHHRTLYNLMRKIHLN